MTRPDFDYLQNEVDNFNENLSYLSWLRDYRIEGDKVVIFGLHKPGQMLAIMHTLKAKNLDAVAGDESQHYREETNIAKLQTGLRSVLHWLQHGEEVTEADIEWWNSEVPEFFKHQLLTRDFYIDFHHKNFSKFTGLPQNYFDVAYIDGLLDQILYDPNIKNSEEIARNIIREMARTVRQKGYVTANQFIRIGHRRTLDFRRMFEVEGLDVLKIKQFLLTLEKGRAIAGGILSQKR